MDMNRKNHWEAVYETKQPNEVSWTQEKPETSLDFIREIHLEKSAKIIDIGGGDKKRVLRSPLFHIPKLCTSKHISHFWRSRPSHYSRAGVGWCSGNTC